MWVPNLCFVTTFSIHRLMDWWKKVWILGVSSQDIEKCPYHKLKSDPLNKNFEFHNFCYCSSKCFKIKGYMQNFSHLSALDIAKRHLQNQWKFTYIPTKNFKALPRPFGAILKSANMAHGHILGWTIYWYRKLRIHAPNIIDKNSQFLLL